MGSPGGRTPTWPAARPSSRRPRGVREAFQALMDARLSRPTGRPWRSSAPRPTPARRPRKSRPGPAGAARPARARRLRAMVHPDRRGHLGPPQAAQSRDRQRGPPGTDGAGAAASTGGALRRQTLQASPRPSGRRPRVRRPRTHVSTSRRKRFAIGIPSSSSWSCCSSPSSASGSGRPRRPCSGLVTASAMASSISPTRTGPGRASSSTRTASSSRACVVPGRPTCRDRRRLGGGRL